MNEFLRLYKKFGGKELFYQWSKSRVLLFAFFELILLGFSKKGLEILRLAVQHKIQLKLKKKYKSVILRSDSYDYDSLPKVLSNKVWICWFQGIENAPLLVKRCYDSLRRNLHDREIIVLDAKNINNYIDLPDYIIQKWNQGVITNTHFSDILRVEVLISHGGTWIDSTVFCTSKDIPHYIFNSDLFLYQMLKPGLNGNSIYISSWLMSSTTNNKVLLLTRDLLYHYWKNNNKLIDYFLLHHFICISLNKYPEERKKIPKVPNSIPHILLLQLFEKYNERSFNAIKSITPFHKLSYKWSNEEVERKDTFYEIIIKKGEIR